MSSKDEKYRKYLEQKHAGFQTDMSLVSDVVKKATGNNLQNAEKIVQGEVNEVYV